MKIETAVREYLIEIEVRKYTPRTIKGYHNVRSCTKKLPLGGAEDRSGKNPERSFSLSTPPTERHSISSSDSIYFSIYIYYSYVAFGVQKRTTFSPIPPRVRGLSTAPPG